MADAGLVCEVIAVGDRFKVTVCVDGTGHEVAPLRTEAEAAVVCDAVELYHALHAELPVEAAQLRFQDGMPEARTALLREYRSGMLAGGSTQQEPLLAVVQQLADCAATLHAPAEVPPPNVAAVGLLGAAVAGGHDAAMHALLIVNPSAAMMEVQISEGPRTVASLLHLAAKVGNSTATKALLAAAPSATTKQGSRAQLPLHHAAQAGHSALVQQLLAAAPQAALVAEEVGWLPLHAAAVKGHSAVVQQLLAAAPQAASVANEEGCLPLHLAAHEGQAAVVQQLLDAAPQAVSVAVHDGALPLYLAAQFGHTTVVRQLLVAAPQTALVPRQDGWLPLHHAALKGHASAAQLLQDAAPQAASVQTQAGWVPLHLAAAEGHSAVVQQLLAAAPQAASVPDEDRWLPLHYAAEEGHLTVVQQLLHAAPQAASIADKDGSLPLQVALDADHGMAAGLLLSAAAAPRQRDLSILLDAGPQGHRLLPTFVSARAPLSAAEWQHILAPCPGILRALPAALACSAEQAREVVQRAPPVDAARLRTALQCLHASQRRTGVTLPFDTFVRILSLAVACDA